MMHIESDGTAFDVSICRSRYSVASLYVTSSRCVKNLKSIGCDTAIDDKSLQSLSSLEMMLGEEVDWRRYFSLISSKHNFKSMKQGARVTILAKMAAQSCLLALASQWMLLYV